MPGDGLVPSVWDSDWKLALHLETLLKGLLTHNAALHVGLRVLLKCVKVLT